MMFNRLVFFILFLYSASSFAAIKVKPEPNIYDNKAVINIVAIKKVIADELYENGLEDKLQIEFLGFENNFELKQKFDEYDVDISEIDINKKSRRFDASIKFTAKDYSETIQVRGRYDEIISVPVLSYRLPHGKVVQASDIEYIDYEKSKVRFDTAQTAKEIIGKELRRSMPEMRPIRKRDLISEQVISKNSVVNMIYKTPFVTLQATGISMDDGAKGDLVRIKNSESSKVVQAEVMDNNLVMVSSQTL